MTGDADPPTGDGRRSVEAIDLADEPSLVERVGAQPGPAALWILAGLVLVAVELGALVRALIAIGGTVPPALAVAVDGADWLATVLPARAGAVGWILVGIVGVTGFLALVETIRVLFPVRRALVALGVDPSRRPTTVARASVAAVLAVVLLASQTGLVGVVDAALGTVVGWAAVLGDLPTLTSRELIPNRGYQNASGAWQETFLGLSPAAAWAIRVGLVYGYAGLWLVWLWKGLDGWQTHYRLADWTPTDDAVDRLRTHRWWQFGFVVIAAFVVMAVFAPTLGPTTVQENIERPYSYEIQYFDEESGSVETVSIGRANRNSRSEGDPDTNVGPLSYDDYGRYHPFGTLTSGKDLFTFIAAGARVSLTIGLVSAGLSALIALVIALTSAYYKGVYDLVLVVAGDTIMGVPRLLVMILLTVLFGETWIAEIYNGGLLLALILAGTGWPYVWRSIRGPALQIVEEEWIDAARSYGQTPTNIMRKHMAPYVLGYLLIYFSMILGGVIIAVAGLTFLGLGITAPTPEWGRAVDLGQDYVATVSWHISLIPGVLITLVVVGFNAMGDGIRDAIDPRMGSGEDAASTVEGRGGGA